MDKGTCAVDGCEKRAKTCGWCSAHYERWRLTGDVNAGVPIRVLVQHGLNAPCAVKGCGRPLRNGGKGWCRLHYDRWRRNGDPLAVKVIIGDDRARFESQIDRSGGPDACHPWTGGRHCDGYGWTSVASTPKLAHMALWELENGPKPPGADLDHECHNRAVREGLCKPGRCEHRLCCNLRHIILRASRKEHRAATVQWVASRGEDNNLAKLTEVQVRELRELLKTARGQRIVEIGQRYGISRRQAYRIKNGEAWGWLPDAA